MAEEKASAAGVTYEKGRLYQLPVGDIQPNPNQPRKYFGEEELAELTQSIKDKGLLQPILVRQEAKRERQEKTTDDQAVAMIVTLAAIITRLENIDWFAISEENRKELQQTLSALGDTFAAIEKTRGVA